MKANNLTISVPNKGCNKNCKYCISKITGDMETDELRFVSNMKKVKHVAEQCGVTSILITGKGEPFLSMENIDSVRFHFPNYPIEVQTNGIALKNDNILHKALNILKIDVFAFSFDSPNDFESFVDVFDYINDSNRVIRVTMNVTNALEECSLTYLIEKCKTYGVRQFSLRDINYPKNFNPKIGHKERKWIDENNNRDIYGYLNDQIYEYSHKGIFLKYPIIRKLPFGATIFDVDGISFTYFDYCVQESANDDEIRSLIYQEDGHLYTSWNSKASIIF